MIRCSSHHSPPNMSTFEGIWHRDAYERIETLKRRGLRGRLSVECEDGLWAIFVRPSRKALMPRVGRPWRLHVSICFDEDRLSVDDLRALRRRWHGRYVTLRLERFGSGGSGVLGGALSRCSILRRLHDRGYYKNRDLHISF